MACLLVTTITATSQQRHSSAKQESRLRLSFDSRQLLVQGAAPTLREMSMVLRLDSTLMRATLVWFIPFHTIFTPTQGNGTTMFEHASPSSHTVYRTLLTLLVQTSSETISQSSSSKMRSSSLTSSTPSSRVQIRRSRRLPPRTTRHGTSSANNRVLCTRCSGLWQEMEYPDHLDTWTGSVFTLSASSPMMELRSS